MIFSSVLSKSVRTVDGSNFTSTFVRYKIVLKICQHLLNPNENNIISSLHWHPFVDNGVANVTPLMEYTVQQNCHKNV